MAEIAANMVFSFNDGMVLIKGYVSFAIKKYKAKAACATLAFDDHSSIYIVSAIFLAI